jgi:hypothetical protein
MNKMDLILNLEQSIYHCKDPRDRVLLILMERVEIMERRIKELDQEIKELRMSPRNKIPTSRE